MPFQLVVIQGGRSNTPAVKIGTGITTVGRQDDCQFRIASSLVSRKHAQLFEEKGRLVIKDLGSSNGSLVNGQKVEGQQTLGPGDKLTIGPVTFRVEAVEASTPAPTGAKPGDTAVAEPIVVEGEAVAVDDEDLIALDDETETNAPGVAPPKPSPTKGSPAKPAPTSKPEIGEDAVADFLLNIELDDEDKP